ncbi:MAG TPA: hypothetical protein VHJ20_17595 [Polyangia bacterium]|nr:hypothetical protein [Polyangia bacterium]
MTGRSAAIQGGLAAIGLLAAHFTWQREPERAPGEIAMVDAAKSEVTHVRYEDQNTILALDRRAGDPETSVWVHLEPKAIENSPVKPGDPPPPPTPPSAPPRDLRGNADAVKLADRFSPLVSPRAFGVVDKAKYVELGLDAPTRHLEMTVRGDVHKYDVGIALHAQNGEAFFRDLRDNRVYLVPRGLLNELGNAKRLIDSRLHTFDTKQFDKIVITAGGKKRELVHFGRDNFSTDAYASVKTPDKRDQMAKNWHDALWRTFPMEVLGKDEKPGEKPGKDPGKLTTVLRVEYSEKGAPVGWIEIARLEGGGGDSSVSGVNDDLYARSEYTLGWTRLHASEELVTDAEKVAATP